MSWARERAVERIAPNCEHYGVSRAAGYTPRVTQKARNPVKLDARDFKILEVIQANGRISKKALADTIGLSLTPCFERLRRLENAGFIRGYRGMVNAERFGPFMWVHVAVTLTRHRAEDFARFESFLQSLPEVVEVDAVGGGIDYLLKLIVRDVPHYQGIIDNLLEMDVGMSTYSTYIVMKRVKEVCLFHAALAKGAGTSPPAEEPPWTRAWISGSRARSWRKSVRSCAICIASGRIATKLPTFARRSMPGCSNRLVPRCRSSPVPSCSLRRAISWRTACVADALFS